MKLEELEIRYVKNEGMPKVSPNRKKRLRKKLHLEEFAEHFIDVKFNITEQLTDEQLNYLMRCPWVTNFSMTGDTLLVSLEASTMLMEFYLALYGIEGKHHIDNHVRIRTTQLSNQLSDITGHSFGDMIKSVHMGDSYYASEDYYWGEGEYA